MLSLPLNLFLREQGVLYPDGFAAYRGYLVGNQVCGRQVNDAVAESVPPGPYQSFCLLPVLL